MAKRRRTAAIKRTESAINQWFRLMAQRGLGPECPTCHHSEWRRFQRPAGSDDYRLYPPGQHSGLWMECRYGCAKWRLASFAEVELHRSGGLEPDLPILSYSVWHTASGALLARFRTKDEAELYVDEISITGAPIAV